MSFFSPFPRFSESQGNRLAARHDCLIETNLELIRGKRVLDIASHDGRWTFAAIRAGCSGIVGVEPRDDLVRRAQENLKAYGVDDSQYSFVVADARDYLAGHSPKPETVLLFGVFYHLHYHVDLVGELRRTGARTIIVDTAVSALPEAEGRYGNTISFVKEPVDNVYCAAQEAFPGCGFSIVEHPSRRAVRFLFESFGYTLRELDWAPFLRKWGTDGLKDYAEGRRTTYVATLGA